MQTVAIAQFLYDMEFQPTPFTVGQGLANSLILEVKGDGTPVRGEEKIKRFNLWFKIKHNLAQEQQVMDFDAAEVVLLKEAVLAFSPLVAGQLNNALDGVAALLP